MRRTKDIGFSAALWVPLLWLALASSRGRLTPNRLVEMDAYQASPVMRAIFTGLIILALIILWKRRIPWQQFLHRNLWVVALFALMGLSVLWSDYQWISFKRFIKTSGVLFMALILLTEPNPFKAFSALIRRFCYLTIPLSAFLVFFVPSYGKRVLVDGTVYWVGVASHKNTLGLIVLIGAMYFTWLLFCQDETPKRRAHWVMLMLSLFLLAGCGSVTSLFAYFAVLGCLILIRMGRAGARHMGAIIVYVVIMAALGYYLVDALIVRQPIALAVVELFGRDLSFTGRMDLWQDVWGRAIQHPLLGHGFGGFWVGGRAETLWQSHEWRPVDSHNGYLDVFAETGLVGLILLGLILLKSYARLTYALLSDFEFARLRLMILIMVLVHNLNETSLCNLTHPYWFLFLFIAVSGPRDWALCQNTVTASGSIQAPAARQPGVNVIG